MTIEELIADARNGSTRAAGRLLSLVESARRDEVLAALGRHRARVIGITGPPGAGKSTTIAVLVAAYRQRGSPSTRRPPIAVVRCSATGSEWRPTSTTPTYSSGRLPPAVTSGDWPKP